MGREEEDSQKLGTVIISEKIWVEEALCKCADWCRTETSGGPQWFNANLLFDDDDQIPLSFGDPTRKNQLDIIS